MIGVSDHLNGFRASIAGSAAGSKEIYPEGAGAKKWEEWRSEWCWIQEADPQPFCLPRRTKVIRGKDWSDFDPQDGKLTVAITRIQHLRAAKLTVEVVAIDFLRRRIAPLQNKGRPAWDFKNAADVMRLYPGLNNNLTILQHTALCHRLFRADAKFKLAAGVIPLCNNSALSSIIAMMSVCNAHGPEGNLEEPSEGIPCFDAGNEIVVEEGGVGGYSDEVFAEMGEN